MAVIHSRDTEKAPVGFSTGYSNLSDNESIRHDDCFSGNNPVYGLQDNLTGVSSQKNNIGNESCSDETGSIRIENAINLYRNGQYEDVIDTLSCPEPEEQESNSKLLLMARSYANMGSLEQAKYLCEKAIELDSLNWENYYLLALIFMEQNEHVQAEKNLTRAIYADPESVLAHFAMGNLLELQGRTREALKHLSTALMILSKHAPDEIIDNSEGLTAGSLNETINIMI